MQILVRRGFKIFSSRLFVDIDFTAENEKIKSVVIFSKFTPYNSYFI